MATADAAHCTACGSYVFLTPEGGCEYGHARSSLLAVYQAEIDGRTGLPRPPLPGAHAREQCLHAMGTHRAPSIGLPMHYDVVSAAIWPAAFTGVVGGAMNRLLSPPRGKHSVSTRAHRSGRGRHSAVVRRGPRAVISAWLAAGLLTACLIGLAAFL